MAVAVLVANVVPSLALANLTVGAVVYPDPGLSIVILVISPVPVSTTALAIAKLPLLKFGCVAKVSSLNDC